MAETTPENLRYHAAGHLAATVLLIGMGDTKGARIVLTAVDQYVNHPNVIAPPQLKTMLQAAMADPEGNVADIHLLEQWFCHPLNTVIENAKVA